jgi:hypothetical protein
MVRAINPPFVEMRQSRSLPTGVLDYPVCRPLPRDAPTALNRGYDSSFLEDTLRIARGQRALRLGCAEATVGARVLPVENRELR